MAALGADFTLFCPAFPEAGRTIYRGYLFVGDVLLSESGMRDHPLTPMRDPSLVRVLQRQSRGRVGLVPQAVVARGAAAIARRFQGAAQGRLCPCHHRCGRRPRSRGDRRGGGRFPLITGGSGIALGLPENFRRRGLLGDGGAADALPPISGPAAVLSGSCSTATLAQVAYMQERAPVFTIDPIAAAAGRDIAAEALAWATPLLGERPVLISASAPPEAVAKVQQRLGRERAGALIEGLFAAIARGLVAAGRAAARRRRRRDRRRGGAGARRHRIAHRPPDRPRRALDGQPPREPRRAGLGAGPQIRQFRRARLFPARLFGSARRPSMTHLTPLPPSPTRRFAPGPPSPALRERVGVRVPPHRRSGR